MATYDSEIAAAAARGDEGGREDNEENLRRGAMLSARKIQGEPHGKWL